MKISTCSGTDKEYKHTISFTSPEEMADKLKFIAQTSDKNITYVDICMPIPFQQVHVYLYMWWFNNAYVLSCLDRIICISFYVFQG